MNLYGKYFRRYKAPFLTAVLCVTMEAICDLLGPTLMSHIVNSGESLAIIGPTGSGKSTIAWLLLRFYDAESGVISFLIAHRLSTIRDADHIMVMGAGQRPHL